MCPVLCSGNGDYEDGVCRCFPGWKGVECQLRSNECEIADCNGNGNCNNGVCVCARGFTGKNCREGRFKKSNNHATQENTTRQKYTLKMLYGFSKRFTLMYQSK